MTSPSSQDSYPPHAATPFPSSVLGGTDFIKINNSNKGTKIRNIKYDPVLQRLTWDSRKLGVIQLEWISCIKGANSIQDFPSSAQDNIPNRIAIYYQFKGVERRLNLIAPTKAIAQEWKTYLGEKMLLPEHFSSRTLNSSSNAFDKRLESWLRQHWAVVDKNKDGKITLKEFKSFLNLINYECSDSNLKALFAVIYL